MTVVDVDLTLTLPATAPCRTVRVVLTGLDRARCDQDPVRLAEQLAATITGTVPHPPSEPPAADTGPRAPDAPAPQVASAPNGSGRAGRPPHAPGTCGWALLAALADDDGTYHGTLPEFAAAVWPRSPDNARTTIGNLATAGLVTVDRISPRKVTAIHLTPAGWTHLGRTAPANPSPPTAPRPERPARPARAATPPAPPDPQPVDEPPAPPAIPDLGPIERRTFDPDAARSGAAAAL